MSLLAAKTREQFVFSICYIYSRVLYSLFRTQSAAKYIQKEKNSLKKKNKERTKE